MPVSMYSASLPVSTRKLKLDDIAFVRGFCSEHISLCTPTTEKFWDEASEIDMSDLGGDYGCTDMFDSCEDYEAESARAPHQYQQPRSLEFMPTSRWYSSILAPATAPQSMLSTPLPIPAHTVDHGSEKQLELDALSHEYEQRALGMFLRVKCFGDVSKLETFLDEDVSSHSQTLQNKDTRALVTPRITTYEQEDLQFSLDLEADS